jgi:hypothetical protein
VCQSVGGRTFKGAAFVAKPDRVEFKDFDVGKEYHLRFILTNVSLTFNSFKVLDLPDAVRDFFEISYVKPGRMSAGTTCAVDVTFTPQVNEDITTELPLLAETGPCAVPIVCTTKKVVPVVAEKHLDFGEVVLGELKTIKLRIENRGALATAYSLVDPDTGALVGSQATSPVDDRSAPPPAAPTPQLLPVDNTDDAEQEIDRLVDLCEEAEAIRLRHSTQRRGEAQLLREAAALSERAFQYPDGRGAMFFASRGTLGPYTEIAHDIHFSPLEQGR